MRRVAALFLLAAALASCSGQSQAPPAAESRGDFVRKLLAAAPAGYQTLAVSVGGSGSGAFAATSVPAMALQCDGAVQVCWAYAPTGTQVSLTASPGPSSTFRGWWGACEGSGACALDMQGDRFLDAFFVRTVDALAVVPSGRGTGTVTGGGISCTTGSSSGCGATVANNLPKATFTLTATPAAGSMFSNWAEGPCQGGTPANVCVVTTSNAAVTTVIAVFQPASASLDVVTGGLGVGTVSGSGISCTSGSPAGCSTGFANATPPAQVTLTATPNGASTFAGWAGACEGSSPTCSLSMSTSRTARAAFAPAGFGLTVRPDLGAGSGTVTGGGIACTTGSPSGCSVTLANTSPPTTVTLTATASPGSLFAGWNGGNCSGTGPCTVTMDGAKTVGAMFVPASFTLAASTAGTGAGTVTGGGLNCSTGSSSGCTSTFANTWPPTAVTLAATPSPGSLFAGWSGGPCASGGPSNQCTVILDRSVAVAAVFGLPAATQFLVGGTIMGLTRAGLVLATAGEPSLPVDAGATSFWFANALPAGTPYAVTIAQQPTGQTCSVSNGSGTVPTGPVTSIAVDCTGPASFAGCGDLAESNVAQRWSYVFAPGPGFATTLSSASSPSPYRGQSFVRAVTTAAFDFAFVYTAASPIDASGYEQLRFAVRAANGNILVGGTPWQGNYPVVVLQDAAGSRRTYAPTANLMPWDGTTWAPIGVPLGGGAGWMVAGAANLAAIARVEIHSDTWEWNQLTIDVDALSFEHPGTVCTDHTVGGVASGLAGSGLVLRNNGGDDLAVAASGAFAFSTRLPPASPYSVTVAQQPAGQTCAVANGTGTVGYANVTSVSVTCGVDVAGSWSGSWAWTSAPGTHYTNVDFELVQSGTAVSGIAFTGIQNRLSGTLTATGFDYSVEYYQPGSGVYDVCSATISPAPTGDQLQGTCVYHSLGGNTDTYSVFATKHVCAPGLTGCSGVCVPLQADFNNCGTCGNVCASGQVCGAGQCIPGSATDVSGTWNDASTLTTCGYACGMGVGYVYHSSLILAMDTPATFHGTYAGIPVNGSMNGNGIAFGFDNLATWAGPCQGQCAGTVSGSVIDYTCDQYCLSPSGLQLNATVTGHATK